MIEKVVVLGDLQIPFQDQDSVNAVLHYLGYSQPDIVVLLGDILDFPSLTTKFTRRHTDPSSLLDELAQAQTLLWAIRDKCRAQIVYLEGNHEERLTSYVQERAPELEGLLEKGGPFDLPTLLDPDNHVRLVYLGPYTEAFELHSFVFTHGEHAGRNPARSELEHWGTSGMSGHAHRFQTAMRTDYAGAHAWYSIGCLCKTKGEGMPPGEIEGASRFRDWQQGFAEVRFWEQGGKVRFNAYPITITDHHFRGPDGSVYGPGGLV